MDKNIIIDGVDVAGCAYVTYRESNNPICSETGQYCKYNQDCYYKQLKRLEQENKELKEEFASFMNGDYCADGCKKMNTTFRDTHTIFINQNNTYRSALEEINKMVECVYCEYDGYDECNPHQCSKIQNKINEVLNDKEL